MSAARPLAFRAPEALHAAVEAAAAAEGLDRSRLRRHKGAHQCGKCGWFFEVVAGHGVEP